MIAGYLSRLGIDEPAAPTLAWLREIQHAHLDVLPFDNLAIMLGRPDPSDPATTLARLAAGGNAGYCFHHNGALELVLRAFGYQVERHAGEVLHGDGGPTGAPNHLALVVTIEGQQWWTEVGYGDGFRDPILLTDGEVVQGPFRYRLDSVGVAGWTFAHDDFGSFTSTVFGPAGWSDEAIAVAHARLSIPPGAFTRLLVVQRRDVDGAERVRGIRHTRVGTGAFVRDLSSFDAWRDVLLGLGVSLRGVGDEELRALHARMLDRHASFAAL